MTDKLNACRRLDGGLAECMEKLRAGISDKALHETVKAFYPRHHETPERTAIAYAHAMHDIGTGIVENLSLMIEEEYRFSQLTRAADAIIKAYQSEGTLRGPFTDAVYAATTLPAIDRAENAARLGYLTDRLYAEIDGGARAPSTAAPHNDDEGQVAYYRESLRHPQDSIGETAARYLETRMTYAAEMAELLLNDASQVLTRSYFSLAAMIGAKDSDPAKMDAIDRSRKTAAIGIAFAHRLYPDMAPRQPIPPVPDMRAPRRTASGVPAVKKRPA